MNNEVSGNRLTEDGALEPTAPSGFWKRVVALYADGFRNMRTGRKLWILILVKLAILFGVLKLFFFPDLLERDYDTDSERAEAVRSHMVR